MSKLKRGIAQITDATVAYGLGIGIMVTLLVPLIIWGAEEYQLNVAAGQANTVQKAVNRYISDQQAAIAAGSSPTSAFTLTVPMLINAGYLPAGYSSTNVYTATYQTLIFQPTANKFHTMTFLTGGAQLTLSQARKLANHIGAAGGYIENGIAKGTQGSWQESLSAFGGFNPGDGHVVIAGFYANGALMNDYLYRHSVAGHPELNTMGTALNMGGNDINNARNGNFSQTVSGQTLNASGDVNTARLTAQQSIQSNGWIAANGNITSNGSIGANGNITSNSNIAAAGNITSSSSIAANGNITSNSSISAAGNVTANGSMSAAGNVSANNDVTANGTLRGNHDLVLGGVIKLQQVNTAGNYCDTWGAISRDGDGAVLSCQSGIWRASSTPKSIVTAHADINRFSGVTAYCPAPKKVVGGGGNCESLSNQGTVWLVTSIPSGDNAWFTYCDSTKSQMIRSTSYAICE